MVNIYNPKAQSPLIVHDNDMTHPKITRTEPTEVLFSIIIIILIRWSDLNIYNYFFLFCTNLSMVSPASRSIGKNKMIIKQRWVNRFFQSMPQNGPTTGTPFQFPWLIIWIRQKECEAVGNGNWQRWMVIVQRMTCSYITYSIPIY